MDKIKLFFVIDHLGGGGAEAQLVEVLNNLNREEFHLSLFLTEGGGSRLKNLRDNIEVFGFRKERKRRILRTIIKLRKTIKEIKPDLIISWLEYSTFITSLSIIGMKIPHIASIRGDLDYIYSQEVNFGKFKKLLLEFVYKRAGNLIFNSYTVAEKNKWIGYKNHVVIYNIFDAEKVNQLPTKEQIRKNLKLREDLFYITFVGSLVKRKGVDLLIEAFKMIRDDNLRLLIIGKGKLEDTLREIAKDDERIEFLGYKEDSLSYIKASDIFILPSFSEGIPNVLIEALACETPVIATDVDGITEIIKNKINGLLIKPGNPKLIKEAIECAIKNYAEMKNFSEEGKNILDLFKKEVMIAKFEKLFKECSSKDF